MTRSPFFLALVFVSFFHLSMNAQDPGRVQTLIQKGHGEAVKALAMSGDGRFLATGSRDKTIKLWDVETGHEIRTFFGHEHTVNDLSFSVDDKYLVSSSADNTARVWDVLSGKELWKSPVHSRYLTAVDFHPKKPWVAVAGYDSPMNVWDWKNNEVVKELETDADMGTGYGVDVAFSPDGKWMALGEDNRKATVISTETWEVKYEFQPTEGWCGGCGTYVDFDPSGNYLLKASNRDGFRSYELGTGEELAVYRKEIDDLSAISISENGTLVSLATEDSLLVFEAISGKLRAAWKQPGKEVTECLLLSEEALIVGDDNGETYVWDIAHGNKPLEFTGTLNDRDFGGVAHDLSDYWNRHIARHLKYKNEQLLVNDRFLFRGKMGTNASLWDLKAGQTTVELAGHEKAVICVDHDPKTGQFITGGGAGGVIVWQGLNGKELMRLEGHRDPVFDVAFSPSGKYIASTCWGGRVIIWDRKTGKQLQQFYFDNVSAYTLCFVGNEQYLMLGFLDQTLQLWDIDSKTKVRDFIGHTKDVTSILPGKDPFSCTTTSKDGRWITWDLGYGLKTRKETHDQGAIYTQAYWQKKDQYFTGGEDRVIRLWKTGGGVDRTLEGHQGEITSLNISSDGKRLYSLDLDGVTKVWDLESFEEVYEYMQLSRADWLIKSPEGYFSGTENAMKRVHFVRGMKSYALDQFFDNFFQPRMISKMLEVGKVESAEDINEFFDKNAPPQVKIAGFANADQTQAKVYIKIKGKSIKEAEIKHNGKRLQVGLKDLAVSQKEEGYTVYSVNLDLVSGHNEFSCRARNRIGVSSSEASVDIMSEQTTPGADCYILSVGLDQYKNKALNLNYAKADAQSFADSLEKYSEGIFRNVHNVALYDADADKARVLATLDSLTKVVSINDVFVFYYAGHGSVVDGHFYFITHECTRLHDDEESMRKKAIPDDEMMLAFQEIKALKQIILMDACQSGGAVELLASRGAMEEKAIAQLSRSAGVHVLAAAGSEQFAVEYDKLGHAFLPMPYLKDYEVWRMALPLMAR